MTHREPKRSTPVHVSLLVVPEAFVSSISGIYDVLTAFDLLSTFEPMITDRAPFHVELVGESSAAMQTASGLPLPVQRHIDDVERTDIVVVPALAVRDGRWDVGRHPELVAWLSKMHASGATMCSACSGVLLLAETGLMEGLEATIHWAYAKTFRDNFPDVPLRLEDVLVASGDRGQFVMSGASASWHDLVMYLVARHVGPVAAQAVSKFMMLLWHREGQAPYAVFQAVLDHGDAPVLAAQEWLGDHFTVSSPVEEVVQRSELPARTFKRRFRKATGYSPLEYVQHLRVAEAKRLLERSDIAVEEIAWRVGYEDPSFFRRLFKRLATITPGAYRRKFQLPAIALR